MDKTKSLLLSKTFWAALIALAATVGKEFGWDFDEQEANKWIENLLTLVQLASLTAVPVFRQLAQARTRLPL